MATTGFPKPQNTALHPLEGLYEVSITPVDRERGFKFVVSLTRNDSKWVGEVRDTPVAVTVKDVTVTGENSLTGSVSIDAGEKTLKVAVKVEGSKIVCDMSDGEKAATLTATKKVTEGKATTTIEGTYEAKAVMEGRDPLLLELVIKRTKPAEK